MKNAATLEAQKISSAVQPRFLSVFMFIVLCGGLYAGAVNQAYECYSFSGVIVTIVFKRATTTSMILWERFCYDACRTLTMRGLDLQSPEQS